MKNILKTAAILAALVVPASSVEIMKITLNNEIQEEKVSEISKIFFNSDQMVTSALYNLDDIKKIEFYDDGTAVADGKMSPSIQAGQIGFAQSGESIKLTIGEAAHMNVSLYSMNGRKIAELYDGTNTGSVSFSLKNHSIAAGVYSVVVKSGSNMFVRKLMVK